MATVDRMAVLLGFELVVDQRPNNHEGRGVVVMKGSDPNRRKRIQLVGGDGRARTIRLGIATEKQAESVKVKVEQIVSASITGVMDDEVSRWLASRDDQTHRRLCAVGLAKPRQQ